MNATDVPALNATESARNSTKESPREVTPPRPKHPAQRWLIRTEDDPTCIGFVQASSHAGAIYLATQRMRLAGRADKIEVVEFPLEKEAVCR